jgi:hypothetical protein
MVFVKILIAPAPSTSGKCNLYCAGPVRKGEDVVLGLFRF